MLFFKTANIQGMSRQEVAQLRRSFAQKTMAKLKQEREDSDTTGKIAS